MVDLIASVLVALGVVYLTALAIIVGARGRGEAGAQGTRAAPAPAPTPPPPPSSWRVIPRGAARCPRCRGLVLDDGLAELYGMPEHDRMCARLTARHADQVEQLLRELGLAGPDPVDVANAAHDELTGGAG